LCLVYGLENCVDFLSSVVVLWRFFAPSKIDDALEAKLHCREKRASIAISFILVLLGLAVIATALDDLSRGQEDPDQLKDVVMVSFVSIFIFGILSVFKFKYALILESPSLYKDGICSLIGTVLSGALFVNTLIIDTVPGVWWIDPLVAIGAGNAAIVIGGRALWAARYKDNLPIFTFSWWMLSQGDGSDERSGRPLGPEDFPENKDANGNAIEMPQANNDEEESEMV
jgi:divalent metal cation (Fe/Co/Zn/Cd) transporter